MKNRFIHEHYEETQDLTLKNPFRPAAADFVVTGSCLADPTPSDSQTVDGTTRRLCGRFN